MFYTVSLRNEIQVCRWTRVYENIMYFSSAVISKIVSGEFWSSYIARIVFLSRKSYKKTDLYPIKLLRKISLMSFYVCNRKAFNEFTQATSKNMISLVTIQAVS